MNPAHDDHTELPIEQPFRATKASLEELIRLRTGAIEMLYDIASHLHEAVSLRDAVGFVLCRMAEFNGWSFGHAFTVPDDDPNRLVPMQAYYEDPRGLFGEFRQATGDLSLKRGEGLPGRALADEEPVWAVNLPDDLRPERAEHVADLPIESATAIPVLVDGRVELVLELFCTHRIPVDERMQHGMSHVALHLARTIERLRTEAALRDSEKRFRELAESINQVFWVFDPLSEQLLYVSPEWSRIVGDSVPKTPLDLQHWRAHVHPDDRVWVDGEFAAKAKRGRFDVVYRVQRVGGAVRWIQDVAVPLHDEAGHVRRIIGVAKDITEQRELERLVADAATHEQQRLSRDLHDSIGQELTGLTMMASKISESLDAKAPNEAAAVSDLVDGLKRTLQQVRRISRGLAAVDVEAGGLTVALAQLAEKTRLAATTECIFRCAKPVSLDDPGAATHLYRIAQEAVSNAIKHADAKTIIISLNVVEPFCQLTIEDDGVGISERAKESSDGIGLRIMRYRANLIGGRFAVDKSPQGGTRIVCRVRRTGQT